VDVTDAVGQRSGGALEVSQHGVGRVLATGHGWGDVDGRQVQLRVLFPHDSPEL
jgi:ribosome maturation factor RimP